MQGIDSNPHALAANIGALKRDISLAKAKRDQIEQAIAARQQALVRLEARYALSCPVRSASSDGAGSK